MGRIGPPAAQRDFGRGLPAISGSGGGPAGRRAARLVYASGPGGPIRRHDMGPYQRDLVSVSVRKEIDSLESFVILLWPPIPRSKRWPMWVRENRGLYERKGARYPSDLSDAEWALIAPLVPPVKRGGRRREVDVREVMNGVLYVLETGCQWRALH